MMSHTMKSTAEEEENALGDDVHVAALAVERYHVEATIERADATMEQRRDIVIQNQRTISGADCTMTYYAKPDQVDRFLQTRLHHVCSDTPLWFA